jgi:hypothetical protein
MSVLWMGGDAWKAAVIWFGSDHLFDPARATTRWPNFDAYTADQLIWGGHLAILVGTPLVVLAAALRTIWLRKATLP